MKELGYDTVEIMENAGTLITAMQVWIVAIIFYFTVIPFSIYIL